MNKNFVNQLNQKEAKAFKELIVLTYYIIKIKFLLIFCYLRNYMNKKNIKKAYVKQKAYSNLFLIIQVTFYTKEIELQFINILLNNYRNIEYEGYFSFFNWKSRGRNYSCQKRKIKY